MKRYTREHEWVEGEGGRFKVGVSVYAQGKLGDVVYVELPEVGRVVARGEAVAVVESVKAASDVYAPVAGEVVAVNERLVDEPGLVNQDAEGLGWFFEVAGEGGREGGAEGEGLMDEEAYAAWTREQ